MKNISTIFLRIALSLGGLFVLAFIIFAMPEFIEEIAAFIPAWFYLPYIFLMYATTLPFYFALYQTFRLLNFVDAGTAFSMKSVKALWNIQYAGLTIGAFYAVVLPILYFIAETQDAPGILALGIVVAGAAFTVSIFASVMQKVLRSAIDMKKENDLTV